MRAIVLARKPVEGSITANVITQGTGCLNIDGTRLATDERLAFSKAAPYTDSEGKQGRTWNPTSTGGMEREQHEGGRWPANVILHGRETVADLAGQSGEVMGSKDGGFKATPARSWKNSSTAGIRRIGYDDAGSAARFFKQVGCE